jgi:hypothetical protein
MQVIILFSFQSSRLHCYSHFSFFWEAWMLGNMKGKLFFTRYIVRYKARSGLGRTGADRDVPRVSYMYHEQLCREDSR